MLPILAAFAVALAGLPVPAAGSESSPAAGEPAFAAAASLVLFGFLVIEPPGPSTASGRAESGRVPMTASPFRADTTRPLGHFRVVADVLRALLDALARLGGAFVFLWSRLSRSGVLDHPTRRLILDHLARSPGATLSDVSSSLNLNRKTAEYHVRRLVLCGALVEAREPPFRRLFVVPRPPTVEPRSTRHRLLAILEREGALTRQDLAARIGITPQGLSHHLLALESDGIVARRGRLFLLARPGQRGASGGP
ncbi:MAG TPA: winged helix-turn-helix transcriptional regulator [Candidatus Thermoplasmatota archaeon]|nr:winged helix-turn-helix transcriptional regulator [Candidatus Thermoplasmatota archaeon]